MKPNRVFLKQPNEFWALVKYVSESLGYSDRSTKGTKLRRYELEEIRAFGKQFSIDHITTNTVLQYLNYRAELIEKGIEPLLMDRREASRVFKKLVANYRPRCALPYNKQTGEKKHLNYLTCIVNVLTEKNLKKSFNDNPRQCCLITDEHNRLVKILSRWMDGVYPGVVDPKAVWEVKEYYGTTTFGSRVADGVYETQLDGYEITEAERLSKRKIEHYLFVDDRFTWWVKGKSYLCRLIDMIHMELVDEVIFGKEVLKRWPEIVRMWK